MLSQEAVNLVSRNLHTNCCLPPEELAPGVSARLAAHRHLTFLCTGGELDYVYSIEAWSSNANKIKNYFCSINQSVVKINDLLYHEIMLIIINNN